MRTCRRCKHENPDRKLFCENCGKVMSQEELRTVRMPGFVGVLHSTSPKIDAFWNGPDAGNPEIFERGYRPPAQ